MIIINYYYCYYYDDLEQEGFLTRVVNSEIDDNLHIFDVLYAGNETSQVYLAEDVLQVMDDPLPCSLPALRVGNPNVSHRREYAEVHLHLRQSNCFMQPKTKS